MRHLALSLWLAGLALTVSGCSTEAWYRGFQQRAESECHRLDAAEREACLARLNRKTYDDYEKERAARRP